MKRHLLFKSLLLLCALVVGSSNVWATDPVTIYSENFGSTSSTSAYYSYTGYSATTSMFTTTGNVNTHYSGAGSIGKNNYAASNLSSGYTGASGNSGCYHQGTAKTEATILQISNINIEGYESLSLSFGALGGSADHKVNVSYIIDSGSETSLISNGSLSNTSWTLKTANIGSTGKSLTLIFKHTPSKQWTIRMDDIKVTGTAGSGGGGGSSTPSISANDVNIAQDATGGSIEYTLNNATGNVSASITSGDWLTLGTITSSTVPFTCSANTGAQRTATVTLSFEGATDKVVTITQAAKTVATPTFSREGGNYMEGLTFTLTSAGNTIYYTTDGSTPSNTSTEYTAPVAIAAGSKTYKAIAYDTYGNASSVTQRTYKGIAPATLPFSWTGTSTAGKTALGNVTGVAGYYLGSDYAASNAPYRLKFEAVNNYVTIYTDGKPECVYFTAKLLSGKADTGSKIKVQGSDDGITFTDIEEFTIKGAANATFEFTTSNAFATTHRAVKLVMSSKDVNVGVGTICVSCIPVTPGYNKITYVTPYKMDFSEVSGLKAYVATAAASSGVTMTRVEAAVPENTPLLLIGTAGTTYNVPVAASATAPATNYLVKGDGTTVFDGSTYDYILYSDGKFYQIGSGTVATNKAYLHLDSEPSGARALDIIIDDDVTAIETVKSEKANNEYYNLAGQRVANPTKGLYIVNGRKVVVK